MEVGGQDSLIRFKDNCRIYSVYHFDQVLYADWNNPIIHHDYFSTDTRNDYSISYNSNSGGEVSYSVGALGLLIYGWNGLQVFHNQKVFFPTYTEIVFKVADFEINTYFTLHWTEFGNDSPGWKNLKRMNSFEVKIYEKTLKIEILQSEISNTNSDGAVVLSSQYSIQNLLKDTWYSVELYRDGLDIDILLDGATICTVQIPEEFLELEMNLAFGIDSFNGYDVYVDEICYGYTY